MNRALLGHLVSLVTVFIWGTTLVSTKILLVYLSPDEILIYRFVIALIALYIMYPWGDRTALRDEILFVSLGFSGIFLYFIFNNLALVYAQASDVGVVEVSAPLITAIIANFVFEDEKFSIRLVVGFILVLFGVGLVLLRGSFRFMIGDLFAFSAACSFGVYSVLLKMVDTRFHFMYVTRKSFVYGLLFMVAYFLFSGETLHADAVVLSVVYLNLMFLGLFASGLCFVFWKIGVGLIGSVAASNYIYLIPLINGVMAVAVLGEGITITLVVGAIMIISGVLLSQNVGVFKRRVGCCEVDGG